MTATAEGIGPAWMSNVAGTTMTSVFLTADMAAFLAGAVVAVVADLRVGFAAALAVAIFAADAGSADLAVDDGFGALVERVVGRFLAAGLRAVAAGFWAVAAGLRAVPAGLRAVPVAFRPAAGVVVDALVVAVDRRRLVPDPDPVDPVDESSAIAFSFGTPAAIVHHHRARRPGNPC